MKNNGKHLAFVAVLVAIGAVVTYYILTAVYQLPIAASAEAGPIDTMFRAHFITISFLFSLIVVFVLYSIVVFRRKPGDEEDGPHVHGNATLEIVWTIVPLITVISFGIWAAFMLADITEANEGEMPVSVTGQRWSWSFAYPDYEDISAQSKLILPVDRPIRLEMSSNDVLHSFWVPEFRVKQDLVPGTQTILRLTPTKEGTYQLGCAEICGYGHATMVAEIEVVSQAAFDQWVSEQTISLAELTPEERGQTWYTEFGCNACHSLDGTQLAGPTWQGLIGRQEQFEGGGTVVVDEEYIHTSIIDPAAQIVAGYQNVMPANFSDRIEQRQAELAAQGIDVDIIADLIAFMHTVE